MNKTTNQSQGSPLSNAKAVKRLAKTKAISQALNMALIEVAKEVNGKKPEIIFISENEGRRMFQEFHETFQIAPVESVSTLDGVIVISSDQLQDGQFTFFPWTN